MGTSSSRIYAYLKHCYYNYNAEFRAHKLLEKEKRAAAPRHPISKPLELTDALRKEIEELYQKDKQLDEYLKKVYLTSTDVGEKVEYTRPKPTKNAKQHPHLFYEPIEPKSGCITVSKFIFMLLNYQSKPDLDMSAVAEEYKMDKKAMVNLLTYYSLFQHERFDFMNVVDLQDDTKPQYIDFEKLKMKEKVPQIDDGTSKKEVS